MLSAGRAPLCLAQQAHAPAGGTKEAQEAKAAGEKRVILFNLSGHGHFDMSAYDNFLAGKLENFGFEPELKK